MKNIIPTPKISYHICLVIMNALGLLGLSFITASLAGSVAKANAANVSMIKLTHNICVTVKGKSTPMNGPIQAIRIATTLMVNWNKMKCCIFLYRLLPHFTPKMIDGNELSSRIISAASLATSVPLFMAIPTSA